MNRSEGNGFNWLHRAESDKTAVVNSLKTEIQFECQIDHLLYLLHYFNFFARIDVRINQVEFQRYFQ